MYVVELSNHPEAMRQRLHSERQATYEAAWAQYEQELAGHRSELDALRSQRKAALAGWKLWRWFRLTLTIQQVYEAAPRQPEQPSGASHQEQAISAGEQGEQLAAYWLGQALDNNWHLLRGYRNNFGEIDQLLLGPTGLFAVEVKHLNAVIYCEGDSWWYTHYDKYGNPKRDGAITDRGGRSPSEQLNRPADALEAFLRSRGQSVQIWRIVFFTHSNSQVVSCTTQTVDLITESPDDVAAYVRSARPAELLPWSRFRSETPLAAPQCTEIERLILRDHSHHNRHRSRRQRR